METVYTAGPAGPGLLSLTFSSGGNYASSTDYFVGSWIGRIGVTREMPITIGESFSVVGLLDLGAQQLDPSTPSLVTEANTNFSVSYQVTHANGNPVELYVVPEPATLALALVGVAMIALWRRRQVRPTRLDAN